MKKLIISTLASLISLAAFAATPIDLGSAGSTPYDRYMAPVKQVLTHLPSNESASMERVRQLMREGRGFRYAYTDPYTAASPVQTAQTRSGDCKAKALWLCDQLHDASVRFVIGKARASSNISHAWVYWKHDSRWWILDCTNLSEPIPADKVSSSEYIPQYSFSKAGTYRHAASQMLMASNTTSAAVASTGAR